MQLQRAAEHRNTVILYLRNCLPEEVDTSVTECTTQHDTSVTRCDPQHDTSITPRHALSCNTTPPRTAGERIAEVREATYEFISSEEVLHSLLSSSHAFRQAYQCDDKDLRAIPLQRGRNEVSIMVCRGTRRRYHRRLTQVVDGGEE